MTTFERDLKFLIKYFGPNNLCGDQGDETRGRQVSEDEVHHRRGEDLRRAREEKKKSTGAALSPTLKTTCWFFVDLVKLVPSDGSTMTSPSLFGCGEKLSV